MSSKAAEVVVTKMHENDEPAESSPPLEMQEGEPAEISNQPAPLNGLQSYIVLHNFM